MEKSKREQRQGLRTYYTLIITQVLSLIGSRISGLAIGIWVYQETGNATPLALVAFFGILPQVLASSFSGVLADRYDRRYVMAIGDAGQALGTLLLLFSFTSGQFELWHLYVVTLIQAIFGVFQGPAFSASVTMLVPEEHRDRANTISQLTGPSAGIIAPAIAGFVYAAVGVAGAIVIDMLTFLIAVAVVLRVHIPKPKQTAEGQAMAGSVWKEMFGGLRFLLERRALLVLMLHVALLNLIMAGTGVLMTPYILARTDNNEAVLGVILSVLNLGALVGGILFGMRKSNKGARIPIMFGGIILMGVFSVLVGIGQTPFVIGLGLFLLLMPSPVINANFMSLLQTKVAPDVQGRVFAFLGQVAMMMMPLSYLLIGPLADQVFEPAVGQAGWETVAPLVGNSVGAGMGLIMVASGVLVSVLTILMYFVPSVRKLETDLPDYVPEVADETPDVAPEPEVALA